ERHQRALPGFVRTVKYVSARPQRSPVLIRPYSEPINVDVLNSHNVCLAIPLLAEEGRRDSLIEAGAPGAKREPVRAKPQLVVSSAKMFCRSDHPVYAFASL